MKIFNLLFPPKCQGCGDILDYTDSDDVFCEKCMKLWEYEKTLCRVEHGGCPTAVYDEEMQKTGQGGICLFSVYYSAKVRMAVQNQLIFSLKEHAPKRVAEFVARELCDIIESEAHFVCRGSAAHENALITWIPRRKKSVRKYGFDHMERVAMCLSEMLDIKALPLLTRLSCSSEQKRLDSKERMRNSESTIKLSLGYDISWADIILIDDVTTSGASIASAARLLFSAGARNIISVALAKSDTPLD